jgi:DNA-binding protein Fis
MTQTEIEDAQSLSQQILAENVSKVLERYFANAKSIDVQ